MPIVRVDLNAKAYERLAHLAVRERRPIPMQAEVLIERAVRRVPVPYLDGAAAPPTQTAPVPVATGEGGGDGSAS